jgi:hypothetical protein
MLSRRDVPQSNKLKLKRGDAQRAPLLYQRGADTTKQTRTVAGQQEADFDPHSLTAAESNDRTTSD